MKIYIKCEEDMTQDNLTNFETVLSNFQQDVNRAADKDVIVKSHFEYHEEWNSLDFHFDTIPSVTNISVAPFSKSKYFGDYFKNYGIRINPYGTWIGVDAEDSTSKVPMSQIQSWYNELVDSYVSEIQNVFGVLQGRDLEEYYQDWYESEIEPRLEEAFPGCNFSAEFRKGDFFLVFSRKDNPNYNGNTLYQGLVLWADHTDRMEFIVQNGYPKDWDKNFIVKMAQKLIKRGVDVNRQLVSQERKEARKREEQAIDLNEIKKYMYEYFGRYLEDHIPDYDSNLLRISNITPNRKSGRIDFDATLAYDGISVKVWMPFERDQSKDIYPYGYNYDKNMSGEMIDKMYGPLERIIDQYT